MLIALRKNARISIADLAQRLKITRATAKKRMQRLENSGTIVGYTVVLNSDISQMPIRGLMQINIGCNDRNKIIDKFTEFTEIIALHTVNGVWDIVLEIACKTLGDFDALTNKLKKIKGICKTEVNILLSTTRNSKPLDNSYSPNANLLKQS